MLNLFSIIAGFVLSVIVSFNVHAFESIKTIYIPILLWLAFYVAIIAVVFLTLFIVSFFLKKTQPKKPNKASYFFVKLIINYICQMSRIKIHIKNGEQIEKGKQYLLVSNHRSKYDPMIQVYKFARCKPIMISKPENLKIPLAGPFINSSGFLAIDRENNREALKTIIKAIDFVEDYGVSVGVCPEGTRNKVDRKLMPMKAGAFKIATKPKIPIVIMTFEGTEKIHKNFPFKKTDIYLDILKVLTPEEYENMSTQDICDYAEKIMTENIESYGATGKEECEKMSA